MADTSPASRRSVDHNQRRSQACLIRVGGWLVLEMALGGFEFQADEPMPHNASDPSLKPCRPPVTAALTTRGDQNQSSGIAASQPALAAGVLQPAGDQPPAVLGDAWFWIERLSGESSQSLVLSTYYKRGTAMRTISVRLDDGSEARLECLCQTLGLSQTEVVKAGLELLQRQSTSPAALAERLGLIGSFSSGPPGSASTSRGRDHSAQLRQKLGRQHVQQRLSEPKG